MSNRKVAFIAHPLNLNTLSIISGVPELVLKFVGKNRVRRYLESTKPFIFTRIQNLSSITGEKIDLVGVACPLLPDQMATLDQDYVINEVTECVRIAEEDGASLAVLGGFTSVVGNEGEEVSRQAGIPITSGNTYTAALTVKGIFKAAEIVGLDLKRARCAVIGATGDIGSACVRYIAKNGLGSIAISARNEDKLKVFADEIMQKYSVKTDIYKTTQEATKNADIIITATSALTTIIEPSSLKPGAIVCDVALPANIAREVARIRSDVLVFEGGLSTIPFFHNIRNRKFNFLMPTNAIYGCLAEGLVLGFADRIENFSIGRGQITPKKMDEMMSLAEKHGFELSDFFCGDKFFSSDDIENLREIIGRNALNGFKEAVTHA